MDLSTIDPATVGATAVTTGGTMYALLKMFFNRIVTENDRTHTEHKERFKLLDQARIDNAVLLANISEIKGHITLLCERVKIIENSNNKSWEQIDKLKASSIL